MNSQLTTLKKPPHFLRDHCRAESLEMSSEKLSMFLPKVMHCHFRDFTLIKNSHTDIQVEVLGSDPHRDQGLERAAAYICGGKKQPFFLCGKNNPLVTPESSWWPWLSGGVWQEELMLLRVGCLACHGQENTAMAQGADILGLWV